MYIPKEVNMKEREQMERVNLRGYMKKLVTSYRKAKSLVLGTYPGRLYESVAFYNKGKPPTFPSIVSH